MVRIIITDGKCNPLEMWDILRVQLYWLYWVYWMLLLLAPRLNVATVGKKNVLILNCIFIFYMQVGPTGKVVGIDHIAELVQASVKNVQADELELLTSGRVKLVGETLKNGIEWYAWNEITNQSLLFLLNIPVLLYKYFIFSHLIDVCFLSVKATVRRVLSKMGKLVIIGWEKKPHLLLYEFSVLAWFTHDILVILFHSQSCVRDVWSELVWNFYTYFPHQLRWVKHLHIPTSGMKEVRLHCTWQEQQPVRRECKQIGVRKWKSLIINYKKKKESGLMF